VRWTWGRIVVADAVVLTIFNFLPVPPLDGGRAVIGAVAAWRGAPLPADALFWVQLGGLALAVAPMTLWTRWTERIDSVVLRWGAPARRR
jgi:Zn-dependent protease